jgi:hypothetical protein
MENKTAVEWLYETLWKQNDYSLPSTILEQAKEMEKQQIIKARTDIYITGNLSAEEYYNKTFKDKL